MGKLHIVGYSDEGDEHNIQRSVQLRLVDASDPVSLDDVRLFARSVWAYETVVVMVKSLTGAPTWQSLLNSEKVSVFWST